MRRFWALNRTTTDGYSSICPAAHLDPCLNFLFGPASESVHEIDDQSFFPLSICTCGRLGRLRIVRFVRGSLIWTVEFKWLRIWTSWYQEIQYEPCIYPVLTWDIRLNCWECIILRESSFSASGKSNFLSQDSQSRDKTVNHKTVNHVIHV